MKYNQTEGTAIGTKCVSPYACLVVGYKEETKLFPSELPTFFSTEEIKIMKEVLRRYMIDGFLLCLVMLNFDSFVICLNNLHPPINYIYEKAKVTRDEKVNVVQILNLLDISVILYSKDKIFTDVYYKIQSPMLQCSSSFLQENHNL